MSLISDTDSKFVFLPIFLRENQIAGFPRHHLEVPAFVLVPLKLKLFDFLVLDCTPGGIPRLTGIKIGLRGKAGLPFL